ncbi:MAG: SMC-Scp complex subunit ScpB [Deltaproteobacteria bacterium RIFCSPLOWO2_12_FULL_40_28]|nr:MAG: SMC-Scp complex subunit ScpB [Deltaproteobacteria bacterium RIFCSPHIGHO2_02_FULL_40_28]OGQ19557.1 MAG: SMC-Scp complex subunit ScpB [Deltaproteobacteria bacterium RIFCSPHIGHO2_12_FULL_40_32]OGQ40834.1 MAG: SMC-Scp complex subunit ScpB [Deltaproteobacteria bacterium RIFCSPLOWO2_02_FULL_40_36]OGQ53949.1 MAG: SMC-Scp complex subunit ScpB [Deltaproteobacteria bacterium RIFCSPLOWO2_12_FULL_40_28]
MEKNQLRAIIEAMLFISTEPISVGEIKTILNKKETDENFSEVPDESSPEVLVEEAAGDQLKARQQALESEISQAEIKEILIDMRTDYQAESKGFELVEVAKGYQFRTKLSLTSYLRAMSKASKPKLSAPAMETLAIVAYQQPLSRTRIEEIRGVDTGGVVKTLLDRDLVKIVGRSEEPGRPILYGTTKFFLEAFGLVTLKDLPTLKDLEALAQVSQSGAQNTESEPREEIEEPFETVFETNEGSDELITELESSMKHLKDIETTIFDENQPADIASPPKP